MTEGGLDIALIIIMAYFFLRGIFRGVVKEVVALLGLFVAFWVASVYWPLGAEHLRPVFELQGQRGIASFIVIFIVVYFFITLISFFVDKIVKLTLSPLVSGLLGALVGVIKGALICGVLLTGAETFIKPSESFFTTSAFWNQYAKPIANQARAWLPEALKEALNKPQQRQLLSNLQNGVGKVKGLLQNSPDNDIPKLQPSAIDWKSIQAIIEKNPQAISPAWRDKLRNISSIESLSKDDLKRFISDHPALFSNAQQSQNTAPPGSNTQPGNKINAPSWSQPARE